MAGKIAEKGWLSLNQVLDLVGLPPRLELVKDGLDVSAGLYRSLALRVARQYLGVVGLGLREVEPEVYQVELAPGAEWRDVAYALAHWANVKQDRLVYQNEEQLLHRGPEGEERRLDNYRDAVLASLGLLQADPGEQNLQARAFRAAVEAALEVEKVRRAA